MKMCMTAVALNRKGKKIIMEDDSILTFGGMLDIHGNDTEDPNLCVLALVQLPNKMWTGVDLRLFDETDIN